MNRSLSLAALAALTSLAAASASADTLQVISGSQRAGTFVAFGTIGQSFTAIDPNLTSFGFQFVALNPTFANPSVSFDLFAGETLVGTSLAPRTFTVPTSVASRTPMWIDIDLTGTSVIVGQRYTAVLSGSNARVGPVLGPDVNIYTGVEQSGDAYAGGRALFSREIYPNCAQTGNCDFNFRVSGTAAVAAVPEPASWAMMVGGVALAGASLRRRRARPLAVSL